MDWKKFFLNPITIIVGIILTLGILAVVGYNYWGWFGGKSDNNVSDENSASPKIPWAGCKRTYEHTDDNPVSGRHKANIYNPDGTVWYETFEYDELGYWVGSQCGWAIIKTPKNGEKYIKQEDVMWHYGRNSSPNSSASETENSRTSSTIPVNKNWNYSKVDVWQKNQQGDTIKLTGAPIPAMFKKGDPIAVQMQSANGNQTIALNQHILDINNAQGWMVVSLYNSSMAPQWTSGYVQKV